MVGFDFFKFVLKIAIRLQLKESQVRAENEKKKWRNNKDDSEADVECYGSTCG